MVGAFQEGLRLITGFGNLTMGQVKMSPIRASVPFPGVTLDGVDLLCKRCRTAGIVVAEEYADLKIENDGMGAEGRVGGMVSVP